MQVRNFSTEIPQTIDWKFNAGATSPSRQMNLYSTLQLAIFISVSIDAVFGQTSPTGKRRKKKPVRKKLDQKGHVQCFECFRDYSGQQPFYGYDLCYNPNLEPQRSLDEYLVTCPKGSGICQIDIHRLNGVFIALERKCSPVCHCICKNSGYGLEREICSECQKPVEYQTFDNNTLPDFICNLPPRTAGYTLSSSWLVNPNLPSDVFAILFTIIFHLHLHIVIYFTP